MIFVRPLTDDERRVLQRLARTEVGRVSERMHMVLLSGRRYPVPQIAAIFDCDEATVRTWLGRFEADGVDGLRDRPRSGRPRTADADARDLIGQTLDAAARRLRLPGRVLDGGDAGGPPGDRARGRPRAGRRCGASCTPSTAAGADPATPCATIRTPAPRWPTSPSGSRGADGGGAGAGRVRRPPAAGAAGDVDCGGGSRCASRPPAATASARSSGRSTWKRGPGTTP